MHHIIKLALVMATLIVLGIATTSTTKADNFSFTGNFTQDDNVLLFNFSVGTTSSVTLRTWSYAGGTNAAGQVIARGGFDPILALFNSSGQIIDQNDDGGPALVPVDAVSGTAWDTFLQATLTPGAYTVSVMQYDNFALGPNLANGFERSGQGNFTTAFGPCAQYNDVSGVANNCRDSHWAFDVLNVNTAVQVPTEPVPEPTTMLLLGTGLAGVAAKVRKRRKARNREEA